MLALVLCGQEGAKVIRVHAQAVLAGVVDVMSVGDRADVKLVGNPMSVASTERTVTC